jgi:two-component system chemotaxis response regulator CheY
MTHDIPSVLLVGHCLPDSSSLTRLIQEAAPAAKVTRVNKDAHLAESAQQTSLLLVNRVLDGRFRQSLGVDLISALRAEGVETPIMLISNYEDAQEAAVAAGAMPGFGKRAIAQPETIERIRMALASSSSTSA